MKKDMNWAVANRLGGLRRFAVSITVFNILGHTLFGFEQSLAQPLTALATAYSMELLLEWIDARLHHRAACFLGGAANFINFLLSAHITGLAVAMLLYPNERLGPIIFATTVAIGSKALFRARVGNSVRHFLNPSNFGITAALLAFPWVGIAPPYHFTENLSGIGDWLLPAFIVISGTFINYRFTRKLPLIAGWLGGFGLQAWLRSLLFGNSLIAGLMPMTGVAFILFTFYMVTDPATTPTRARSQVVFGAAVALAYGVLMKAHIVFGLFFALTLVTLLRGVALYAQVQVAARATADASPQLQTQVARTLKVEL